MDFWFIVAILIVFLSFIGFLYIVYIKTDKEVNNQIQAHLHTMYMSYIMQLWIILRDNNLKFPNLKEHAENLDGFGDVEYIKEVQKQYQEFTKGK